VGGEPGGWPVVNRPDTESCYIVSGRATVTDEATGEKQEISAGDVIVFPKGWSGRWDVTETIRKVYSIVVRPPTDERSAQAPTVTGRSPLTLT
jgi:uncharacterized cupin superfamily protein